MELYTTQMDAARRGIETEAMKRVAEYENMPLSNLMGLVAKGRLLYLPTRITVA